VEAADHTEGRRGLSPALLIAGTPLVGYALAYAHERGATSVYHIPSQFIAVDIASALAAALSVFLAALAGMSTVNLLYVFFPTRASPAIQVRALFLGLAIVVFVILNLTYQGHWLEWIWIPVSMVGFVGLLSVVPLITERKTKGYRAKLQAAHERSETSGREPDVYNWLSSVVGHGKFLLVAGLLLALALAYATGRASSFRARDHLVIKGPRPLVVLRTYGHTVIAARFDPAGQCITGEFRIFDLSREALTATREHLGDLSRRCRTPSA
jgi:hypothetical protein